MSNNSSAFRISNEQLLLINILNSMYYDNLRQINNLNETLNNLNNSNNQIRNLLIHLLNINQTNGLNSRRNGFSERRNRMANDASTNDRNSNSNSNRIFVNNRPYIIESISRQTIPTTNLFPSLRNSTMSYIGTTELENLYNNFMQPLEVYPTQSQIEAASRRVRYCDISRPINTQCPISMEDFDDNDMVTVIRHCGHIFQTEHIMNWFRSSCRCPVCRYDIRDYNSNASTEFFNNSSQNHSRSNTTYTNTPSNIIDSIDSSNNILERSFINVTDNINSLGSNSNNNLYNDIFNDTIFDNLSGFMDVSGNNIDNMFGGSTLAMLLLNAMNRTRNSR